jgi:hypothetical protein
MHAASGSLPSVRVSYQKGTYLAPGLSPARPIRPDRVRSGVFWLSSFVTLGRPVYGVPHGRSQAGGRQLPSPGRCGPNPVETAAPAREAWPGLLTPKCWPRRSGRFEPGPGDVFTGAAMATVWATIPKNRNGLWQIAISRGVRGVSGGQRRACAANPSLPLHPACVANLPMQKTRRRTRGTGAGSPTRSCPDARSEPLLGIRIALLPSSGGLIRKLGRLPIPPAKGDSNPGGAL